MSVDKKTFWDRKILDWERKNYTPGLWGKAVRERQSMFFELAGKALRGMTVFEQGCGTGRLIERLFELDVSRYVGCDLSEVAIREAKARVARLGLSHKVELHNASVLDLASQPADLAFSLGLWDWLSDEEIARTTASTQATYYFHSYSETEPSLPQFFHRAYVHVLYGHKNGSYVPRYRTSEQITDLMEKQDLPTFYRNRRMSFSAFAIHLPA